jgi:hypothetical protein
MLGVPANVVTAYPAQVFLDLYAPVNEGFLHRINHLMSNSLESADPQLLAGEG